MIIGLVAGALVMVYGTDRAKEWAENREVPKFVLKKALADGKIAKVREELKEDIRSKVESELKPMTATINEDIEKRVRATVDALNEIYCR